MANEIDGLIGGIDAGAANHCFVCGQSNPMGLHVHFALVNEVCVARFTPGPMHVGYAGLTHGGIVFSLLDDVMAKACGCAARSALPRAAKFAIARHCRSAPRFGWKAALPAGESA